MGVAELISSLGDNPYFGAGFGLFGVGAGAAILRRATVIGTILFRRYYITTLEVPSNDKSYSWLLQWVTYRGARNTRHLSIQTAVDETDTGKILTKQDFIPSTGEHYFWYKRAFIKVNRDRSQQTIDLQMGIPFETITFSMLGNQRQLLYDIVDEAKQMAVEKTEGKTIIYTAMSHEWKPFGHPRKPRPLKSVFLEEGASEEILHDVVNFLNSSDWYRKRGIPYRRGYLLYGPPGCGKSSFISALAGELQFSICIVNLSDQYMDDARLNHLLANAPQNSIILLEDIDGAFPDREDSDKTRTAYEGMSRLTLSGLLNCLDGVAATEARIVFMTTNYYEKLDKALIRKGRVDLEKEIGYCTHDQIQRMFAGFYPDSDIDLSIEFAKKASATGKLISAASLQGHLMVYKDCPEDAIDSVEDISDSQFRRNI